MRVRCSTAHCTKIRDDNRQAVRLYSENNRAYQEKPEPRSLFCEMGYEVYASWYPFEFLFKTDLRLKRQLRFVKRMTDRELRANIVHYGSGRCHRVTRSVMAAEVHALLHAVHISMLI